jgi:hypothetical protein
MTHRVTIRNPEAGEVRTAEQEEINKYMSMTNGDVMNWIVGGKLALTLYDPITSDRQRPIFEEMPKGSIALSKPEKHD